jgi:hypothetical protein
MIYLMQVLIFQTNVITILLDEVNSGVETDWMAIPLRTSYALRSNLRLEGGDNQFRYSAAIQNNNTAGVMKGSSEIR